MFLRPRHRVRICLLLLAVMLFQVVAVSAYACPTSPVRAPAMPPGMEHCEQMAKAAASTPAPALCEKHCAPDNALPSDAGALQVPPLLAAPEFTLVLRAPAIQAALHAEVPLSRSDPPPRLRYCSLLI